MVVNINSYMCRQCDDIPCSVVRVVHLQRDIALTIDSLGVDQCVVLDDISVSVC